MPLYSYRGVVPRLGGGVFLAPGAWVIGDVTLGSEVSVWFDAVIRGDVNAIRIVTLKESYRRALGSGCELIEGS
jgi:carbonic anhydrase/acetyltransferase-like protein (isoleucine patch superfamily)